MRRIRIGLRMVLLLVTILAVCFAVIGAIYRDIRAANKRGSVYVLLTVYQQRRVFLQKQLPGDSPWKAKQLQMTIAHLDNEIVYLEKELSRLTDK